MKLIDKTFKSWINNYPESYHPMDMDRFYVLVKTACRYDRAGRDGTWLREQIRNSNRILQSDVIDYYCNLFDHLKSFNKVVALSPYTEMPVKSS